MDAQPQELPHVDGDVGLPGAPGAAKLQRLIDGGFSSEEVTAWRDEQTQTLFKGGFTPDEIDEYWGDKDPGIARMRQAFDANWELIPAEKQPEIAMNTAEYFQAGLDYSATSLIMKPQDYVLPEDAGLWAKITAASGQMIGDLPPALAGYFAGAPVGGAIATSVGGPGAAPLGGVLGGNFGAGAAPELIRQTAIRMRRERGDGKDLTFRDVMAQLAETGWETTKAGTISMVGGTTGNYVGKAATAAGANRVVAGGAEIGSAALSMTATAAALDMRVPDEGEFIEAAAIMLVQAIGLKAVGMTVGATRRFVPSKKTEDVKSNMEDIYIRTGIPPDILASMAKRDPAVMQEVMAPRAADGTEVTPGANRAAIQEVQPYYRPQLKVEVIDKTKPEAPKPGEALTPEQAVEARIDAQLPVVLELEKSPDRKGVPQVSPAGAIGRYQIMPGTAKYYGLDPTRLNEPAYNEMAARAVLKDLNEKFDGNLVDILVAYNAGPGRAKSWIKGGRKRDDLPLETQRYLERAEANGFLDTDFIGTRMDEVMKAQDGDWVPPGGKPPGPPRPPGAADGPDGPLLLDTDYRMKMDADMATEIILERIGRSDDGKDWTVAGAPRYVWNAMRGEMETARGVDEAFARSGLNLSREQMTVEDMVRQTYASRDRASYFVRYGTLEPIAFTEKSKDNYILGYRQVKEDGGTLEQFIAWRLASRHLEKQNQGIDTGLPDRAAEVLAKDKAAIARYRRGADTIARVKDAVVDYYQESGRLTKEQAKKMKDLNREHIVMRRVFDPKYTPKPYRGGKKFVSSATLKKMEGSDRMIVDPVMADIDNIHFMVAMADMNRAIGDVVGRIEFLERQGKSPETLPITRADAESAKLAEKYATAKYKVKGEDAEKVGVILDQDGKPIPLSKEVREAIDELVADRELRTDLKANQFIYWRDGKPEVWEAKDPALVDLLSVRWPTKENPVTAALTLMSRVVRAGVVFAPDFPIRSAIIGEFAKLTTEQYKTAPFKDLASGAVELITNRKAGSDWYMRWIREGGGGATLAELERKYLTKDMEKLLEETGSEGALANAFKHPLEAMEAASMWIDTAGRLGTYKRLVNERKLPGPKAATESRIAHLDHAEHLAESWANNLSRWIPFARTVTKDLETFGRAVKRDPLTTAAFIAAFVTLPTTVNWLVNKLIDQTIPDEDANERYSEQPQYERDNYYVLPAIAGVRFKVSRTYTAGYLYGAMVERALDAAWDAGEITVADLLTSVNKWILPGVIPVAGVPIYENATGNNLLNGRPVVPVSMQGNSPWMQYGPATTETAKKLATLLGEPSLGPGSMVPNPSPLWIEEYFRAWTGTLPLKVLRELERPFKVQQPRQLADIPFVGAFFARQPGTNAYSIQKFYDDMEKVAVSQDDFRTAIERGNEEELDLSMDRLSAVKVTGIATALRNMSAVVRDIAEDPEMTNDEKRGFTDHLVNDMIMLSKFGSEVIAAEKADE